LKSALNKALKSARFAEIDGADKRAGWRTALKFALFAEFEARAAELRAGAKGTENDDERERSGKERRRAPRWGAGESQFVF
jgi:hypothetical protein